MKEFEKKVKEIFHYVNEYGIKNKPINPGSSNVSEEDFAEFIGWVHKGFRLGQALILSEIIPLLKELKNLKEEKKKARRDKQKEKLEEVELYLNRTNYKIQVLRHFADHIAWLILKKDYYKARRLYSGDRNRPDLLHTNLESVIITVEQLHKQDDSSFALIADLTTFIDIGDILWKRTDYITVVECKQGEKQKRVFDFLDELSVEDFDVTKLNFDGINDKFFDQVDRTLNQMRKGSRLVNFINKEKGLDPFTGKFIHVVETYQPQVHYYEELMKKIEESKIRGSSNGEVDNIIYFGIYRDDQTGISTGLFERLVNQKYPKNIVMNYRNIIHLPLRETLFFKPFGMENIFDIIFGRLTILLAINLDELVKLFNSKGISAKWLSKKETHKILDKGDKPFVHQNQAISIKFQEREMTLGSSFLIYLMLDNLTPTSFVRRYDGTS